MGGGNCALGNNRPQICLDFPMRQSDIDNCGKNTGEKTICSAKIGGEGCTHCGQCCKDLPFPPFGIPETNYKTWMITDKISPKYGWCIHYLGD